MINRNCCIVVAVGTVLVGLAIVLWVIFNGHNELSSIAESNSEKDESKSNLNNDTLIFTSIVSWMSSIYL